ncbi:MAG: nucleotidyltransferase family protein [Pelagibacteraceae bacterium]|nr:nucleotidyltransferase family protein [Pelagibacteraceae bacterium]PHX89529.1 MAG: nucleotidyltransferase [Pelagibacteraceae bacterium]
MKIKTALILCAGYGKRLNPLTLKTPKPLLKLNNITMLKSCINLIENLGIKKILINTFYLNKKIANYLKNNKFKSEIKIIDDGKFILNTGGGILNMIRTSLDEHFLIFNPDTVWSKNYKEEIIKMEKFYFSKNINNILMLVNKNLSFDKKLNSDFTLQNHLVSKTTKNDLIYIGCQILNKKLFKNYKVHNFSIVKIWNDLIKKKKLFGFKSLNKFYHLTDLRVFKKLQDL